jgi:hypothetical protein
MAGIERARVANAGRAHLSSFNRYLCPVEAHAVWPDHGAIGYVQLPIQDVQEHLHVVIARLRQK